MTKKKKNCVNFLGSKELCLHVFQLSLTSESVMHYSFCFLSLRKEFISETCKKCNETIQIKFMWVADLWSERQSINWLTKHDNDGQLAKVRVLPPNLERANRKQYKNNMLISVKTSENVVTAFLE